MTDMDAIGRYVRMAALPGQAEALRERMLAVAEAVRDAPGCLLYVVNQAADDPDTIWITELWRSQEAADAALQTEGAQAAMPGVLELVDRGQLERIDMVPVGGHGFAPPGRGYAIVHLPDLEDAAARFGFGEQGEARFARAALGAQDTGLSVQRLHPGKRQAFGHSHHLDEEIYVVLEGGGRIAVDDELVEIKALDAIRVAAGSTRAFQAGPEGLTFLATGAHHAGDAEMVPGFWPGTASEG